MFSKKRLTALLTVLLLVSVFALLTACAGGGTDNGDKDDCTHESYGEWQLTKSPTCKEVGKRTRVCDGCGKTEEENVPVVAHSFEQYDSDNNATCKDGTKSAYCKFGCGATDTVVDVGSGTGLHDGGIATCYSAPICNLCGSPYGYKVNHGFENYVSNKNATCTVDGTETAYCKYNCGTSDTRTEVGSAGHKGGTATCTVKAKCEVCFERYGSLSGHSFKDYVYNNDATCGDGTETATCSNSGCNEKHTRTKVGSGSGKHTGGEEKCGFLKVCDVCDSPYGLIVQHIFENYVSDNNATCKDGTKTAKCERDGCEETKTVTEVGSAGNNHAYELVGITPVSCTSPSVKNEKCSLCGKENEVTLAPATGHSLMTFSEVSRTPVSGKDCTYSVVFSGKCINCGEADASTTEEKVIHNEKVNVTAPATCQAAGEKTYKCQSCNAPARTESYTDVNAHTWEADGDPVSGVQVYVCTVPNCDAEKSVIETTENTYTANTSALSVSEVKLAGISLKLDSATVGQLGQADVTLKAAEIGSGERNTLLTKLTSDQKVALKDKPVYDFSMTSGGTAVSEFNGKIRVTVPYRIQTGDDPECVIVWFITDDGKVEQIAATYSNGYATFETDHFSKYAVTSTTPENACAVNGHSYRENGDPVLPTCTSIGYTVLSCTRCGQTAQGSMLPALGHKYGTEPAYTAPTCFTTGKYVYTCTVSGCGHVQELVIPTSHNFETVAYKSANCMEDGYCKDKCTDCGFMREFEYKKDPLNHDYVRDARLAYGATSCADGVELFTSCKVKGCDYYAHTAYIYTHDPLYNHKEDYVLGAEIQEIDLCEYLPMDDMSIYGSFSLKLNVTQSECACGKTVACVEFFDESGIFNLSGVRIDSYSFSGSVNTDPFLYTSMPMGPYAPTVCIMVVNTVEQNGCNKEYGVEVYIDYKEADGSFAKKLSFDMGSEPSHNTYQSVELKYEGTKCDDGVIITTACRDCGAVIGTAVTTPNAGKHYYICDRLPYKLNTENSSLGHEARFDEYVCACGSREYRLVAPQCSFVKVEGTENEYACSCGHRYKEVITEERQSDCITVRKQSVRFDYDSETGTYTGVQPLPAYVYTQYHFLTAKTEYSNVRGCKADITTTYACECGYVRPGVSYEYDGSIHEYVTTKTVMPDGSKVSITKCKKCDYEEVIVSDPNDYVMYSYTVYTDCDTSVKIRQSHTYGFFNGNSLMLTSKLEVLTDNGTGDWQTSVYFYKTDEYGNIITVIYTVDSLGNSSYEQRY